MQRTWLTVLVALLVPLAGCAKQSDDETTQGTGTTTTGPGANQTVLLNLTITSAPSGPVNETDTFNVRWTANVTSGPNTTVLSSTSLRWSNTSVAQPTNATAYPFRAGERTNAAPGAFQANLTVNWTGTIYLRAFAQVGARMFWSAETQVTVRKMPVGSAEAVNIPLLAKTAVGGGYSPDPKNIKRGDTITWNNNDNEAHTASSKAGSAFTFDTGNIPGGDSAEPIQFTKTGTFEYYCKLHPSMEATVVVT